MPIICRFISTQKIVNVSRTYLKAGVLINKAISEGIAQPGELEEITLDDATFNQLMQAEADANPPPPDPLLPYIRSFAQKMIALGFTKAELKAVFTYIARKIE